MDLSLGEEQEAIDELFRGLLSKECPPEVVRDAEPLGFDARLWATLAGAGAAGMALPGNTGGGGLSLLEAALLAEHVGRHLAPVPFIEHTVAGRLLATLEPGAAALEALAAGERIATLALQPAHEGTARLVPGGAVADVVLALEGDTVVCCETASPGSGPANLASSPLADRALGGARSLASGAAAGRAYTRALDEWRALTASTLVGVAGGALDLGLAYVKEREQFGVPIGSFQAIQHGLAEVAVQLDGARLLARKAAWAFDQDPDDATRLAGMALLFCAETAQLAAARSLHYHGGYGFSLEYDVQLYYRRAKGWPLAIDAPTREYRRLADVVLGPRGEA